MATENPQEHHVLQQRGNTVNTNSTGSHQTPSGLLALTLKI